MVACHLNVGILKLIVLSNMGFLPSDGAYPRRERRGIAPVQRITTIEIIRMVLTIGLTARISGQQRTVLISNRLYYCMLVQVLLCY